VGLRASLDAVMKRKIPSLPGIEPVSCSDAGRYFICLHLLSVIFSSVFSMFSSSAHNATEIETRNDKFCFCSPYV
jgi:hypothetical protein